MLRYYKELSANNKLICVSTFGRYVVLSHDNFQNIAANNLIDYICCYYLIFIHINVVEFPSTHSSIGILFLV